MMHQNKQPRWNRFATAISLAMVMVGAALAWPSARAAAATIWTGTVDNDWNNAGNWDNGVPAANDAFVGAGETVATSADAPPFQRLNLQNTTGLLTVGHLMTLERFDDLHADLSGNGASGNLRIISGGSLNLSGDGSAFLFFLHGNTGISTAVVDGGSITATDANVDFRIGGANNQDAIFTLNSGAVDIAGRVRVGSPNVSSRGSMDLNGGTFTYGGDFLLQGRRGPPAEGGELNINGATVLGTGTGTSFSVGASSSTGNYGLVNLASGSLTLGTDTAMSVGPTGSSFAPASAGRLVISGGDFTAPGEATLIRIASFGDSSFVVPTAASGGLNQSGGTARIEGELRIGSGTSSTAGSTGYYIHRGGEMTVSNASGTGLLRVAFDSSRLVISGGTITADQFQIDARSVAFLNDAGELHGGGGTLVGPVNFEGELRPGFEHGFAPATVPGTLNIHGDLTLASTAESFFDFKDPTLAADTFDSILNDGADTASFGGLLTLRFFGGEYQPGTVAIFDNFAGYTGDFDSVTVTGLPGGQTATFDPTNGTVTIVPEPASLGLAGLGVLIVLLARRQRKPGLIGGATAALGLMLAAAPASAALVFLDTFDLGAPPTRNDDAADPLDRQWYKTDRPTLSVVPDAVIGSGNALDVDNPTDFEKLGANFAAVSLAAVNDAVVLSFDFRHTNTGSGEFRFGLYNSGGSPISGDSGNKRLSNTTDDIGYLIGLGVGGDRRFSEREGPEGEGILGGPGGTNEKSLGAGSAPAFDGILDDDAHAIRLTIRRLIDGVHLRVEVDGTSVIDVSDTGDAFFVTDFDVVGIGIGGQAAVFDYRLDNIRLETAVIPEPATAALLAVGVLLLFGFRPRTIHNPR